MRCQSPDPELLQRIPQSADIEHRPDTGCPASVGTRWPRRAELPLIQRDAATRSGATTGKKCAISDPPGSRSSSVVRSSICAKLKSNADSYETKAALELEDVLVRIRAPVQTGSLRYSNPNSANEAS
jgi:hypothetical protein